MNILYIQLKRYIMKLAILIHRREIYNISSFKKLDKLLILRPY